MRKTCKDQLDRNALQLKKLVVRHNVLVSAIPNPPGDGMTVTEDAALRGDLPWRQEAEMVRQRRQLL